MILAKLIGWFTGGGFASIAKELRQAQKDKLDAANDRDRLAVSERIETLQQRRLAQVTGSATWLPKAVRAGFTAPFLAYNAKLIFYDKMMGLGATDGLSPELYAIQTIIIGFYFLDATISKIR